jgi:ion channel
MESGLPTEGVAEAASMPEEKGQVFAGPPLTVSPDGAIGRVNARISPMGRFDNSLLDLVQQRSTLQLFLIWMGTIVVSGFAYWFGAWIGDHGLVEAGRPVAADLKGFISAIYFSFVTATSIGYGDIVPVGGARVIAVAEAVAALLTFGAVVAKFVSHRQDLLMSEIHRVTFEERLDRVQTNLHMVIAEMLTITDMREAPHPPLNRIQARLGSVAILFQGELRTTHDLLYQPRLVVEEGVLSAILASVSSALDVMAELLAKLPPEFVRTPGFEIPLRNIARIAREICGECVPHTYTPRLVFWMDRIHETADRIK